MDGLHELLLQQLFTAVLGQVQQVKAGVRNRQVLIPSSRRLNDQSEALHSQDGNAVTSGQEHYTKGSEAKKGCQTKRLI